MTTVEAQAPVTPTSNAPPIDIYAPSTGIAPPTCRPLKVYAYDPSHGQKLGNSLTINVPYEPLAPGPVGSRFAVVDYDGARKRYYKPVDLDDPHILLRGGLEPSEVDPRFHQQMVYAVASETLRRFEAALGRRIHWRTARDAKNDPIYESMVDKEGKEHPGPPNLLYLHPHAMNEANAYYSPDDHAIVFGYFQAGNGDVGQNLPGQTVFTCLSHDVVAHEVTHAIVDSVRKYFMEATNIDVAAFHEAFADLAALFRHFSHSELLLDTLQRTGGRLFTKDLDVDRRVTGPSTMAKPESPEGEATALLQMQKAQENPLIALATQFGHATGMAGSLRSALGTPANANDIKTLVEPHARGSILVAAVFDAYFTIYLARTKRYFQLFRPSRDGDDLPQPLAELLAEEASRTAEMFFGICARALDYCPPVDITFGDFLRAVITADIELYPNDPDGVRDALMQSFRLRGIVPGDALYFSEGSLCWPKIAPEHRPVIEGLLFGDPNGLTVGEKTHNAALLHAWAIENAAMLDFDAKQYIEVPSFHPVFRTTGDGRLETDMVVEMVQTTAPPSDASTDDTAGQPFTIRYGVTLIVEKPSMVNGRRPLPRVRYAIRKPPSPKRAEQQRAMLTADGVAPDCRINFAMIHGGTKTWSAM